MYDYVWHSCWGQQPAFGGRFFLYCGSSQSRLGSGHLYSLSNAIIFPSFFFFKMFYCHLFISLYSKKYIIVIVYGITLGVKCLCVCPFEDKEEHQVPCFNLYFSILRQGLSLSLELGWWAANPNDPPVSAPPKSWGYRYAWTYLVFYMGFWTLVLVTDKPSPETLFCFLWILVIYSGWVWICSPPASAPE